MMRSVLSEDCKGRTLRYRRPMMNGERVPRSTRENTHRQRTKADPSILKSSIAVLHSARVRSKSDDWLFSKQVLFSTKPGSSCSCSQKPLPYLCFYLSPCSDKICLATFFNRASIINTYIHAVSRTNCIRKNIQKMQCSKIYRSLLTRTWPHTATLASFRESHLFILFHTR